MARRRTVRVVVSLFPVLALRWHLPLVMSSLRGAATIDATVAAFLATFVLGVLGLPGFLSALWRSGTPQAWWVGAGLLATIIASCSTLLWVAVAVSQIGTTLSAWTIAGFVVPCVATGVTAIWLRADVARVTRP